MGQQEEVSKEEVSKELYELEHDIHKMAALYAKKKGFAQYLQTSSLFGTNVKNVFDEAIEHTINNRKVKCAILHSHEDLKSKNKIEEEKKKKRKCVIF